MKLHFLLVALCAGFAMHANAQTCRDLFRDANRLVQEGKLAKAKTKYQQVVNCGDGFYVPDSKEKIRWINRVLAKPSKAKPFALSDNQITIPHQGGQDVITVDGDGAWTASVSGQGKDWCKIRREKGKVCVISAENESSEERTCDITITMGGKSKKVRVRNESAPEILVPSVEDVTFPSRGETNTVEIRSNTDWKVADAPGWIVTEKEDGKVTLTAKANDNNRERKADVRIESTSKAVIINIYQGAGLDSLAFSKNDLHFGPDGGDEYINVYTDADNWAFGDFPHWCQVTRVADNMLKIHCTANEPYNLSREASVNVTTGRQTLGVNVSQDPKPMVATVPDIGIGGRAISFGITAGYVAPMLSTSAGGSFKGSAVNYALGSNAEEADYSAQGGFTVGAFADIRLYKNFYLKAGLEYLQYKYKNKFSGDVVRISALQTDVYEKGTTQNRYTEDYSMSFLDIPVLASYRIPVTRISHVQISLGPVISLGLSAKLKLSGNTDADNMYRYKIVNRQLTDQRADAYRYEWHYGGSGELDMYAKDVAYTETWSDAALTNTTVKKNQTFEASPLKRLNMGARIAVGYEYAGISLSVEYNFMLTNMANKKFWESERWKVFDQGADAIMSGYKQRNHYLAVKLAYTLRY